MFKSGINFKLKRSVDESTLHTFGYTTKDVEWILSQKSFISVNAPRDDEYIYYYNALRGRKNPFDKNWVEIFKIGHNHPLTDLFLPDKKDAITINIR